MRLMKIIAPALALMVLGGTAIAESKNMVEAEIPSKKLWGTRYSFEFDDHTVYVDLGKDTSFDKVTGGSAGGKHATVHVTANKVGSGFKIVNFPVERIFGTLNGKHIAVFRKNTEDKQPWVEFEAANQKGEYAATLHAGRKAQQ